VSGWGSIDNALFRSTVFGVSDVSIGPSDWLEMRDLKSELCTGVVAG